jgi:hypothetical protein
VNFIGVEEEDSVDKVLFGVVKSAACSFSISAVVVVVVVVDFVVVVVIEDEDSVVEVLFGVVSLSGSGVVLVAGIHVKPDINKLSLLKPMTSTDSSVPSGQGGRVVKIPAWVVDIVEWVVENVVIVVIEVEDSVVEVLFVVFGIHVKPDITKLSLLKPMTSMDSSVSSGQGGRVVEILAWVVDIVDWVV